MEWRFWKRWLPLDLDTPKERLVQTSSGWAVVRLGYHGTAGLGVNAKRFAADGWEAPARTWFERGGTSREPESLAGFLVAQLSVPRPEAAALARDIRGPWLEDYERRGGRREDQRVERWAGVLIAALALLIALAVLGVVLLVWWLAS